MMGNSTKTRLSDKIGRRNNHIDQLRLMAALAVVVGHCWHIALGPDAHVPFETLTVFGFHELAVHVFFFLSGLLVTESARRNQTTPVKYLYRRSKRIFPALIVNAISIPILLSLTGAWTGQTPASMLEYAVRAISLFSVQFSHPHAFAGLPFEGAINGSLWSLRHEIIVYAVLCAAGVFGALNNSWRRAIFFGAVLSMIIVGHALAPIANGGLEFIIAEGRFVMFSFLLGVMAHQFAERIPLRMWLILPGLFAPVLNLLLPVPELIAQLSVIYLVCALTLLAAYHVDDAKGLKRDVSYGVYIYSWPLQQLSLYLVFKWFGVLLSPQALLLVCLPPILLSAYISWISIEKPALNFKPRSIQYDRLLNQAKRSI
ncbi:MAG: acyltransferase [Pseudomonadota bacterium]